MALGWPPAVNFIFGPFYSESFNDLISAISSKESLLIFFVVNAYVASEKAINGGSKGDRQSQQSLVRQTTCLRILKVSFEHLISNIMKLG
jgi:hypothetical protein